MVALALSCLGLPAARPAQAAPRCEDVAPGPGRLPPLIRLSAGVPGCLRSSPPFGHQPEPTLRGPARRAWSLARAQVPAPVRQSVAVPAAPALPAPEPAAPLELPAPEPAAPPPSILSDCQLLAWYGNPLTPSLGLVGEFPMAELLDRPDGLGQGRPSLRQLAARYDALNGRRCIIPAFHLIYATVWSAGELGYLRTELVLEFVRFAEEQGMVVILDHQLGRYDVLEGVATMLPFLSYPSVHLAIDPEWRTERPGEEIGWVSGAEVNAAQALIQDYLQAQGVPGRKLLLVHQFRDSMIRDRELVRADFPGVQLVHVADGFGAPSVKIGRYQANRLASQLPIKGFKLFFPTSRRQWGTDEPLMSPEEVLALDPVPAVIIYQ